MKMVGFLAFKKKEHFLLKVIKFPYIIVKSIVFIIISPLAIVYDILRRDSTLDKIWAVYFLIFSIIPIIFSLIIINYNIDRTESIYDKVSTYSKYSNIMIEVDDVPYKKLINYHAIQNNLNPGLIAAIIERESSFDPEAVSSAGAKGLMQLMPGTWNYIMPESSCDGYHPPPAKEEDCIYDPYTNIKAGTMYLRMLLDELDGNTITVLAAYNAGIGNVSRYGEGREFNIPNFPETQEYVERVITTWKEHSSPLPYIDMNEVFLLYDFIIKLILFSIGLWILLGLWIFLKFDKKTIHTFKYTE